MIVATALGDFYSHITIEGQQVYLMDWGLQKYHVAFSGAEVVEQIHHSHRHLIHADEEIPAVVPVASEVFVDRRPFNPAALAEIHGLYLMHSDGGDALLDGWIDQVIRENEKTVLSIKGGKVQAIGALVGAVMKLGRGKVDAKKVNEKIREKLK